MFSFLTNALLVALLTGNLGGVNWSQQSGDPTRRINQITNVEERLGPIDEAWEMFWQIDQPAPLTPVRVHGGLGP